MGRAWSQLSLVCNVQERRWAAAVAASTRGWVSASVAMSDQEIAGAEKGIFEAKLRSTKVTITFAPGFLQIFQELQSTYYVSRDAELFESQEADAPRVGFVKVGDTVAVLHNASSNWERCQLKRRDGLVGWTHAYAQGGQRVLNLRDPGTKRIAAIPIEGLAWKVVSKKALQLTTGKGQRVTLNMSLPPSMIVEHLEANAADLAAIKAKAVQIGAQAHKQWKSSHSVSATGEAAGDEDEASAVSVVRPHREELQAILDDVQQRLQVATGDPRNAQHVAEQSLLQLGAHPPKAWWLAGLSSAHTDTVIWAEDIANGEATLSPRAATLAPFPGEDPPENWARGEGTKPLELDPEAGELEPRPEPEPEPEVLDDTEKEKRLPIVTLEEQVYAEAQPLADPADTGESAQDEELATQAAEKLTTDDSNVAEAGGAEEDAVASGGSPGRHSSVEDFHAAIAAGASPRRARMSDATLRRRREFAARKKRQLANQSGPNDYSAVGMSALRDPDVAQLVSEALERDKRVDELRHHKPVYRDIYSRRRRRIAGRGDGHDVMMLPIHLPAQQPSLRDGLDAARAPRSWTLSRPHSREGAYAQAMRGAHLSVNIPRPNSRESVGLASDSTHWGHNDFLSVQESERNRAFAFSESFHDTSAMAPYAIGDDLRPCSPLPSFEARPASPSGFGFSAPQRPQSPPSDVWHFDAGISTATAAPPGTGAGVSRTVPYLPESRARTPGVSGSRRSSVDASIAAFAPASAAGVTSTSVASRASLNSSQNKHATNYEMRFFNSGQRYDMLRGLVPRATTPTLPAPIRVENLPDPASVLPLTLDDLLSSASSAPVGPATTSSVRPAAQAAKSTQQKKLNPMPLTRHVEPTVPQITVRAITMPAK